MGSELPEQSSAKARKRPAAKAAKLQDVGKVKSTLHLGLEASRRLTVHAAMLGMDRSALVEQLIKENLRRFVVSDRGGGLDGSADSGAGMAEQGRAGESAGSALGIF